MRVEAASMIFKGNLLAFSPDEELPSTSFVVLDESNALSNAVAITVNFE
jgi:hypothetical protein